jgi:pyrophosphatase PpaX
VSAFPVVLFDLDGTVVDTGGIILASMRHATREVLGREYSDHDLMKAVGGPGLAAQMEALAPEHVDDLVRVYREHNLPLHEDVEPFEGIEDVLLRLHEDGVRIGVVTAKWRSTVELAFARLRVADLFEAVVGGDETTKHKPDPEPLLLAAQRLGVEPQDCAYVGDSPFDIRAAKAAHMYSIGVTWGGIHDGDVLALEEPAALVHTAQELYDRL